MSIDVQKINTASKHGADRLSHSSANALTSMPKKNHETCDSSYHILDENTLKTIAKCDDLQTVRAIEINVDVARGPLIDFGVYLPCLRHLKLTKSFVPEIRDLGSSFGNLRILCMPRCCLRNLDGLSAMPCLTEAYLAFNEIEDITACSFLEKIEVLDLEGNLVKEKKCLVYLKPCENLSSLSLIGNPLVDSCGGSKFYRKLVKKTLQQIKILDDQPVGRSTPIKSDYDVMLFEREWDYINDVLQEIGLVASKQKPSASMVESTLEDRPFTPLQQHQAQTSIQPGRCGQGIRPSTAQKLAKSNVKSPITSVCSSRNASQLDLRPTSSSSCVTVAAESSEVDETASELTTGHVICGDIGKALRYRRGSANPPTSSSHQKTPPLGEEQTKSALKLFKEKFHIKGVPRPSAQGKGEIKRLQDTDPALRGIFEQETELKVQCDEVLKELAVWRKQHVKNHKLFHAKKPETQILRINHSEAEGDLQLLSTDSDSTLEEIHQTSPRHVDSKSVKVKGNETAELGDGNALEKQPSFSSKHANNPLPLKSNAGDDGEIKKTSENSGTKMISPRTSSNTMTNPRTNQQPQLPKISTAQPKQDGLPKTSVFNSPLKNNGTSTVYQARMANKAPLPSKPRISSTTSLDMKLRNSSKNTLPTTIRTTRPALKSATSAKNPPPLPSKLRLHQE